MNGDALAHLTALLVALPITGALVCILLPVRYRSMAGLVFAWLTAITAVAAAWSLPILGSQRHELGGWAAPLGITLNIDGLAGVFILTTALVGLPVSIYAKTFFTASAKGGHGSPLFWPLWLILWGGMNGLYLSADLFNLYVVIEVVGISAVALAILSGKPPALRAGLRYLLAAIVGSMAYLMGVALIYGSTGVLDLVMAAEAVEATLTFRIAFSLMVVGLLVKTAIFPLHFWLPDAHSAAEPPVSAILSALVIKGTFYLLIRLWVDLFDVTLTFAAGQSLGALGAIAFIWGSYQALRQPRLKLVVAHSTVGQVGLMCLLFPLITLGYEVTPYPEWLAHAWVGGIYQAIAHAFAKASLFLAIGIYVYAIGSDHIDSMVDLVRRLPMTTFAIGLSGMSLIGLPPSGGFVAKWMLLKAAMASGQWWWVPVIVLGSFLTAGYVFMILRHAFAPSKVEIQLKPVPRGLEITALILGIGAILIGLRAEEVLLMLDVDTPFEEPVGEGEEGGGQ